jgi:hypothetical protein
MGNIMIASPLEKIIARLVTITVIAWFRWGTAGIAQETSADKPAAEPWLKDRLEWFQDQKFGFMMHFGVYSQWGCIESWPLVEEDKWARPDDLKAWTDRDQDLGRFQRDYRAL